MIQVWKFTKLLIECNGHKVTGNYNAYGMKGGYVSHTDTTMCGSLNFKELHQGYSSVIRLLGIFCNFKL
jgi:hypothetical protein